MSNVAENPSETLLSKKEVSRLVPTDPIKAAIEYPYRSVMCWVTRDIGGMRVVIYKVRRQITKGERFFHWKGGAYFIDTAFVRFVDKIPILMYDINYTETMEVKMLKTGDVHQLKVHIPLEVENEFVHFSPDVEMILKAEVVKQAVAGVKPPKVDTKTREIIMYLLVGAVMGGGLGYILAGSHLFGH